MLESSLDGKGGTLCGNSTLPLTRWVTLSVTWQIASCSYSRLNWRLIDRRCDEQNGETRKD